MGYIICEIEYRGEIPSEHGTLFSGEKNGRAAAGKKSGAVGEKLGEKRLEPKNRVTLGCLWSRKHHEKKRPHGGRGKSCVRSAPKKPATLRLGGKWR